MANFGINGFGRIGRNVLRTAIDDPNIEFVAVNDLTSPETLAHLLKYDSILGNLKQEIKAEGDSINVAGKKVKVFSEKDPAAINWESVGAQIVIESTGKFTEAEQAVNGAGPREGVGGARKRKFAKPTISKLMSFTGPGAKLM